MISALCIISIGGKTKVKGSLLKITEDMAGSNEWRCIANNSFNGKNYSKTIDAVFAAGGIWLCCLSFLE
jgi:hypothetical protein